MIGDNITHYRIEKKLGEGGMGEVYLAEDSSLKRHVALKFLPPHLQQDTDALKRFLREAESAASLEHPYICNIKALPKSMIFILYRSNDKIAINQRKYFRKNK